MTIIETIDHFLTGVLIGAAGAFPVLLVLLLIFGR